MKEASAAETTTIFSSAIEATVASIAPLDSGAEGKKKKVKWFVKKQYS